MTIFILNIFISPYLAGQSADAASGLGWDILIYIVMAAGFIIIGFLASNFYNKVRVKEIETSIDGDKERLNRRVNTLEKEIKHLYAKDDEQTVIINNLKKQLQIPQSPDFPRKHNSDQTDDHLDLFSDPQSEE